MKYEDLILSFCSAYLKGYIAQVAVKHKFYMLDNLGTAPASPLLRSAGPIRYPVRVTMSFCIYCKSGHISARVQQKDFSVGAGDLLIIFAEQILEYTSLTEDCKVIFFAIDSDYVMTEVRSRHRKTLRHWLLSSKKPMLIHLPQDDADNFEHLCRSIQYIVKTSDSEYADGIISGFTAIFGNLMLNWGSEKPGPEDMEQKHDKAETILMKFQSDIHSFSAKFRSVAYYSRRQNLSSRHFARLIKEASGRKPLDIIREYVVLEAKSLLISEKYTVHEVAEKLGFQNDSFFNRYFRSATGLTPGEFMRQGQA